MGSFDISEGNKTGRGKKNPQNTRLSATPSGEVAQTLASATSEQGAEQGGVGYMVRVRTGPECPEDNLREIM